MRIIFFHNKKHYFCDSLSTIYSMNRNFYVFSALLGALFFAACSERKMEANVNSEVEVKLASQILTRVSNSQWEANDEVGVFMYLYGEKLSDASICNNANNCKYLATTTGELSPATELDRMYYPTDKNVSFIAYYPFGNTEGYSVNLDVKQQDEPAEIDFLYSNNLENATVTSSTQQLTFSHQLSRIIFNIKADNSLNKNELTDLTVTIRDAVSDATFSLVDGSLVLGTQKVDMRLPTSTSEGVVRAEGIMIPQDCTDGTIIISLTSGKNFYFNLKDKNLWEGGKQYLYEIELTASTVGANLSATISEWEDGEAGDVEDITTSQVWDGTSANTNWYTEEGTTFTLYQPADLAGLAQLVNEGNNLEGKTIYLSADLDMNNKPWTPIGNSDPNAFKGTFDGNNLQIKNLNPITTGNINMASLFGVSEGIIRELQVSGNFNIEHTGSSILYVGGVCGINKGTVQQCRSHVNTVAYMKKETEEETRIYAGGIVGDLMGVVSSCQNYGTITAENINTNAKAYLHIGGITGSASNGASVSSSENMCKLTGRNGNVRIGGIVAIASGESVSVSDCSNYGEVFIEASHNEAAAGGIVGKNATKATIKAVYNEGAVNITLTSGEKTYGGGLIGINDGATLLSGENQGDVTVTGSPTEESAAAAGGIVGYNINAATVHQGINKGTSVASNATYCFAGGITGFNNAATETIAYTYSCCTNKGMPTLWVGNGTTANNLITDIEHTDN